MTELRGRARTLRLLANEGLRLSVPAPAMTRPPRPNAPIPMTRRNMISLGAVALLGLSVPLILQTIPRKPRRIHPDIVRRVLADAGSPSAGSATDGVSVVVFSDYQCPICRSNEPVIERAIRRNPGVRFVFKDWPIFGPRSDYAARVALAAARQDRFMPLHDALMRTPDPLTTATVQKLALAAGIDWREASRSLQDPGLRSQPPAWASPVRSLVVGARGHTRLPRGRRPLRRPVEPDHAGPSHQGRAPILIAVLQLHRR